MTERMAGTPWAWFSALGQQLSQNLWKDIKSQDLQLLSRQRLTETFALLKPSFAMV